LDFFNSTEEEEKMDKIYLEIEKAREVIEKRKADVGLMEDVVNFLGEIPDPLKNFPRAILARQIATPNFECIHFWEKAKNNGFEPICLEYKNDLFCTNNRQKTSLGKLTFHHGIGRKGGYRNSVVKLVNLGQEDGKRLCEVMTKQGEVLSDLHSRLLFQAIPTAETFEMSSWLGTGGAKEYYLKFLCLFVCHGVLFENFIDKGKEGLFSNQVVLPALETIEKRFGCQPLIVKMLDDAEERKWDWYPGYLEKIVC
jgi:hypothetical protein